jgi:50S ribosomal protein L16 3-hydroxylase
MDIDTRTPLLGGLSPATFMRKHWHKSPLLVRQAWPAVKPPLPRKDLFALAESDEVEARLIRRKGHDWMVRKGPFQRRALPPLQQPNWTLLVQGLDLHVDAAHQMLRRFDFIPHARLDDLMVSWASPGGGVGPHLDSYDVFLIQVQGQRRWQVGRAADTSFVPDAPLKLLRHFEPEHEWVLDPGDMLYLPPLWAHDGVAVGGDCMTCSVGFRAPVEEELARDLLQRLADEDLDVERLYRDPRQPATLAPGAVPDAMLDFARKAVQRRLADPSWLQRALGEALTEPKPQVWFPDTGQAVGAAGVRLSSRTRMLHDARHVFINGEAFAAAGRDAKLMRQLADSRTLDAPSVARLSPQARALLDQWLQQGWVQGWVQSQED